MDFVANFQLNKNDLEANFELNQPVQFDALFEINPAGASWGSITGTLSNQTDLQNALDLKADKTELDADVELLNQTITEAYNTLDGKIDDVNSDLSGDISTLNTNIQNEATTRAENDSLLQGDINTLNINLTAEISNRATADSNLQTQITNNYTTLNNAIGTETTNRQNADSNLQSQIDTINSKIPVQASSTNKLADKDFVNSSIATNTANFIGTFNSVAELEAYSGTLTNNDYAFVTGTDQAGNTYYDRYKWNGSEWLYEYELNNSSFTAEQWASINSGITSGDVALIATALQPSDLNGYATETYVNNGLATKQDTLTAGTGISIVNNVISNTQTSAEWGNIQGTLSNQTDLQNALNAKLNVSDVTEYTAQEVETLWGSIQ